MPPPTPPAPTRASRPNPIALGVLMALLAAVAFGVTTPLIASFGVGVGPWTTAGLLYGGAAAASLFMRPADAGSLERSQVARVLAVALLGAVVAPVCLAWGLPRTGAAVASLLLNFEAVFTVLLARLLFREPIGGRAGAGVALMVAGGALLVSAAGAAREGGSVLGAVAILAASLAWASDNALTRPLADFDPTLVVLWKGAIGCALSLTVAITAREALPRAGAAIALAGCGAVGYGASLRLYLLAQRRIGAARTGSVFAVAPFVGAGVAFALGDRHGGFATVAAGALFAAAVYLHLTEEHGHDHVHEALDHSHAHRHDDAHHDHAHDTYPAGEHTHWHRHDPRAHAHPHGPDAHHRHRH